MRKSIHNITLILLLLTAVSPLFGETAQIEKVDINKLDRTMTQYKAQKRHFKNKKEFEHQKVQKKYIQKSHKQVSQHLQTKHQKRYKTTHDRNRRYYDPTYDYSYGYYDNAPYRHRPYGRTYHHPKHGWVLAYKYDRAEFYDRDGFHYGYFNRYGYMFEGEFYRYDRYYRYHDRVRGRGLFDRYYYRPAEWRYYGFCR
jgi:hypothetical protein